ncbi:MAG: hypothetical protein Q4G19_00565 [Clostridia bacterium]|nr:hypothetical protein [Clostridia bacterium]
MKKVLSILLCLSLLVSVIGFAAADELKVVTIGLNHSSDLDGGKWYSSNELKVLQEQYGIKIEYVYYDSEQYANLIAGGDFPDIMTANDTYLQTIRDNNWALNLDEYQDKLPHVFSETYTQTNQLSRDLLGGEEKKLLFLFPGIGPENTNGNDNDGWGIKVRWDLYKELGYPEINTADDWIQVMKDMVALYPETESGEKVYGIGTWNAFSRFYQTGCMLVEGGNLNPWVYGGTMYMSGWEDTVLYNGYTNTERSAYWTAMKFFNKCWREGLFDEDSFVMTSDELKAKVRAGRYVSAVPYEGKELYPEVSKDDPETLMAIVNVGAPAAFVFANKLQLTGNAPSDNLWVNAKCKDLDATLQVLDFFSDPDTIRMMYNGIKGVDWDYDENGKPYITEKGLKDIADYGRSTPEYYEATGIYGQICEFIRFVDTGVHPDGYTYNLTETFDVRAQTLNSWQKDYSEHYGVSCPSEYLVQTVKEGKTNDLSNDYGQMIALAFPTTPTDIKMIMDECAKIAQEAMPELIMAKTDEEFEAVQQRLFEEWEEAGESEAWAWAEKTFNDAKAGMQPVFEEAHNAFMETLK